MNQSSHQKKSFSQSPAWKESPFIRLLIPLIAGIVVQQKVNVNSSFTAILIISSFIAVILLGSLSVSFKFRYGWTIGITLNLLVFACGMFRVPRLIGAASSYQRPTLDSCRLLWITIDEPLSEKTSSYKTVGVIKSAGNEETVSARRILIYLQKDTSTSTLAYGDQLVFRDNLKPVKGMGNPAAFDYGRYCNLQGIYHQAYLTPTDFIQLPNKEINVVKSFLYSSQQKIVSILQKYVPGKTESGMAEALLIGYKEDLEKSLIQSYSNTGVVHIIAISGLHLGLIYGLLAGLCNILRLKKFLVRALIIIGGLWAFSLLAGAGPSILRSAVMFTFIVAAKSLKREIPIFNSLAASAFALLFYNPMWLWDVGFQLSYAAVTSLVLFYKPVYNLGFFPNRLLDNLWKLNAVTIAAQLLTLPLTLFYFHQFPNMFLFTNLATVPLSSAILLAEIILCIVSFLNPLASIFGSLVFYMIKLMNFLVLYFEKFPGALWENLQLDFYQVLLMYAGTASSVLWLKQRNKFALYLTLIFMLSFAGLRSLSFYKSSIQQKLIVYNVPSFHAVDFIKGRRYFFHAGEPLRYNPSLINFHIKPSRILHRIAGNESRKILIEHSGIASFCGARILMIDRALPLQHSPEFKPCIDVLILSSNAKVSIAEIVSRFSIKHLVFDSSNSNFTIKKWTEQCSQLGISFYSVPDKGAFVMNLN